MPMPNGEDFAYLAPLRRSFARKNGLRRYIGPKRVFALVFLTAIVAAGWYLRKFNILEPSVVFRLLETHPILGRSFLLRFMALLS